MRHCLKLGWEAPDCGRLIKSTSLWFAASGVAVKVTSPVVAAEMSTDNVSRPVGATTIGGGVDARVTGIEEVAVEPDVGVYAGEIDRVPEGTFFGLVLCPSVPLSTLRGRDGARPQSGESAEHGAHGLLACAVGVGGADAAPYVVTAAIVAESVVADGSAK